MKIIYLSRDLACAVVDTPAPGDVYRDASLGDCRRLTAKRLCLAAERAGRKSIAILGLLRAIDGAAEDGMYDGRAVDDWYGLIGLSPPRRAPAVLAPVPCSRCGMTHYALDDDGEIWLDGVCATCWTEMDWIAQGRDNGLPALRRQNAHDSDAEKKIPYPAPPGVRRLPLQDDDARGPADGRAISRRRAATG